MKLSYSPSYHSLRKLTNLTYDEILEHDGVYTDHVPDLPYYYSHYVVAVINGYAVLLKSRYSSDPYITDGWISCFEYDYQPDVPLPKLNKVFNMNTCEYTYLYPPSLFRRFINWLIGPST